MLFSTKPKGIMKVNKSIIRIISLVLIICLLLGILGFENLKTEDLNIESPWDGMEEVKPESLIRFHVIANSDSPEDQGLKYAVRDAILGEVAPRLARSQSLEESREIIVSMEDQFINIANKVIHSWDRDDCVSIDYGRHLFPTKSYGNIVLPAGEYEAVKIKIGKAEGANWWCVLFPPLCFVNVKESTTLPVDGKAGVPIGTIKQKNLDDQMVLTVYKGNNVGFFLERFFR